MPGGTLDRQGLADCVNRTSVRNTAATPDASCTAACIMMSSRSRCLTTSHSRPAVQLCGSKSQQPRTAGPDLEWPDMFFHRYRRPSLREIAIHTMYVDRLPIIEEKSATDAPFPEDSLSSRSRYFSSRRASIAEIGTSALPQRANGIAIATTTTRSIVKATATSLSFFALPQNTFVAHVIISGLSINRYSGATKANRTIKFLRPSPLDSNHPKCPLVCSKHDA